MLIPPDNLDEEPGILDRIRHGNPTEHYETLRRRKDGTLLDISLTVSPIFGPRGEIVGASKIARDITEYKLAQRALRRSETHEREARQEAQAADRSKDLFLATLSHEMRTPLNAILGWAVLLRTRGMKAGQSIDAEVDHGLAVIERNARAQGQLIEDVLDVARIVSGKFQLDRRDCDLSALVSAAADAIRPAAQLKGITVDVIAGPQDSLGSLTLKVDASRVNQAVLNLLGNAVKFTPREGRVTLRLERDGERARIIVSDTGKGIRPEFLPLIFDRFKQADSGSTRAVGGLGLGLTIARHIAELHGGTVTVRSEGEGRGSTFTLELPLLVPEPAESGTEAVLGDEAVHTPVSTPRLVRLDDVRVLVVDDEEDARTMAKMALETVGAIVTTAASAEEAFQKAARSTPPPARSGQRLGHARRGRILADPPAARGRRPRPPVAGGGPDGLRGPRGSPPRAARRVPDPHAQAHRSARTHRGGGELGRADPGLNNSAPKQAHAEDPSGRGVAIKTTEAP
jgi:signal transduction histidine kinase